VHNRRYAGDLEKLGDDRGMTDPFARSLDFVLAREGGYSADKNDLGGETKYGVSRKSYPDLDIKNLTIAQASEIYRKDYWEPNWCDQMPFWAAFVVFDTAVNMGRHHAVICLQRTAGLRDDGKLTAELLRTIKHLDPHDGLADYLSYRIVRYAGLAGWPRFGRGWARRCALLAMEAFDDQSTHVA
jgi:lysozyme family protein